MPLGGKSFTPINSQVHDSQRTVKPPSHTIITRSRSRSESAKRNKVTTRLRSESVGLPRNVKSNQNSPVRSRVRLNSPITTRAKSTIKPPLNAENTIEASHDSGISKFRVPASNIDKGITLTSHTKGDGNSISDRETQSHYVGNIIDGILESITQSPLDDKSTKDTDNPTLTHGLNRKTSHYESDNEELLSQVHLLGTPPHTPILSESPIPVRPGLQHQNRPAGVILRELNTKLRALAHDVKDEDSVTNSLKCKVKSLTNTYLTSPTPVQSPASNSPQEQSPDRQIIEQTQYATPTGSFSSPSTSKSSNSQEVTKIAISPQLTSDKITNHVIPVSADLGKEQFGRRRDVGTDTPPPSNLQVPSTFRGVLDDRSRRADSTLPDSLAGGLNTYTETGWHFSTPGENFLSPKAYWTARQASPTEYLKVWSDLRTDSRERPQPRVEGQIFPSCNLDTLTQNLSTTDNNTSSKPVGKGSGPDFTDHPPNSGVINGLKDVTSVLDNQVHATQSPNATEGLTDLFESLRLQTGKQQTTSHRSEEEPLDENSELISFHSDDTLTFSSPSDSDLSDNMSIPNSITPGYFHGNELENAKAWLDLFERYKRLKQWADDSIVISFPLFLRDSALIWFNNLEDEQKSSYESIRLNFVNRYFPQENLIWVRREKFNARTQTSTESVDDYVQDKIRLGRDCDKEEKDLLEHIVSGFQPHIRLYVMEGKPSTVSKATELAKVAEAFRGPSTATVGLEELNKKLTQLTNDISSLKPKGVLPIIEQPRNDMNYRNHNDNTHFRDHRGPLNRPLSYPQGQMRRPDYPRNRPPQHPRQMSNQPQFNPQGRQAQNGPNTNRQFRMNSNRRYDPCRSCGGFGHPRANCRFLNVRCHRCQRIGHISSVCMSSQQ